MSDDETPEGGLLFEDGDAKEVVSEAETKAIVAKVTKDEQTAVSKIDQELHDEKIKDLRSRRTLRTRVAIGAAAFLVIELAIVLVLAWTTGVGVWRLNEWVIGTFINGVIVQHYFVIRIIVSNLFPRDEKL
jgi:hypothetical protein